MTRLQRWLGPALLGIGCMVAAGLANTVMIAAIKHLAQATPAGPGLHPFQIGFFRCLIGFLVLLPAIRHAGGWRAVMGTRRPGLHLVRGVLNAAGMLAFFLAVSLAPLASVSAINFTSPLFATLLAILLLGERVGPRRWAALAVGFAGMLAILRPGLGVVAPGALFALGASLFWAGAMIAIKRLTDTDRPLAITAWAALSVGLFTLPAALWVWRWPDPAEWAWLLAIGALGSAIQLLLTKAFQLADTSVVLPFDFLKLVWASLFGLLLFAEVPDAWTWIGGTVIFASSVAIAVHERRTDAPGGAGPAGGRAG